MTTTNTPKTDLEIFQALRIEALEKELQKARDLITELGEGINNYVNNIDVIHSDVDIPDHSEWKKAFDNI